MNFNAIIDIIDVENTNVERRWMIRHHNVLILTFEIFINQTQPMIVESRVSISKAQRRGHDANFLSFALL